MSVPDSTPIRTPVWVVKREKQIMSVGVELDVVSSVSDYTDGVSFCFRNSGSYQLAVQEADVYLTEVEALEELCWRLTGFIAYQQKQLDQHTARVNELRRGDK
jgi:hypothetical protein